MTNETDVTAELLSEASRNIRFSPHCKRVAQARAPKCLTTTHRMILEIYAIGRDNTLGFVSNALAYGRIFTISARYHSNAISLLKGGYLKVLRVDAPPPEGSAAKRETPYANTHYLIEAVTKNS